MTPYYDKVRQRNRVDDPKALLKRRVDDRGNMLTQAETKGALIKLIKDSDRACVQAIHRPLSEEVIQGLKSKFCATCSIDRSMDEIVSEVKLSSGTLLRLNLFHFRQFAWNAEG